MSRYFIKLAYDGRNYHGWQSQINAKSVQSEIEKCLTLKLGNTIRLTGCGRTDTGVHAKIYYAHFDLVLTLENEAIQRLINSINLFLPSDIVLYDLFEVTPEASARFDAISRTYKYYIHQKKNPFIDNYSLFHYGNLNLNAMQQASRVLFEYEDFTSFSKLHTQTKTNNCIILEANWQKFDDNLVFTISADRFLRNMVRAIVGTMLEIGKGTLSIEGFREVIESKNRSNAGFSVSGHALFLENISYPDKILLNQSNT